MTTTEPDIFEQIPLAKLRPHPDNIRHDLGDLTKLGASIKQQGVLEPLLVLPADAKGVHLIVAGHRRHGGAKLAKLATVPCVVRDLTPVQVLEAMLTENLQRQDVTPVEEAQAYSKLVGLGSTPRSIAAHIGRPEKHVKDRMGLLALPDEVLAMVTDERLTLAGAAAVVKFAGDAEAIEHWVKQATAGGGSWQNEQAMRDPARILDTYQRARALDRAVQSVTDKARNAGLAIFEPPAPGWWGRGGPLSQPMWLSELGLDEAKHSAQLCHAVHVRVVDRHDAKVEPVATCTSPVRHTSKAKAEDKSALQISAAKARSLSSNSSAGGGPSDAEKADKRAKRDAAKVRMAFMADVLTRKVGASVTLDLLVGYVVARCTNDEARLAVQMLGLEPKEARYSGKDWQGTLIDEANTTQGARVRVALAITLASGEAFASYGGGSFPEHLQRLQEMGHVLSPVERKALPKPAKPTRARKAAATK